MEKIRLSRICHCLGYWLTKACHPRHCQVFFFLNFIVLCEIFKDVLGRRKVKKNNMLNMINTVTNLFAAHDF